MLTLHYNNQPIPTGLDFSLRLVWSNPATRFDSIPGDAGLGIDIPVNDYSRAIFGNPQRYEKYTSASARKFPNFTIRYDGVLLQSGTLVITSATSEKYSGWLQSDVGVMGEAQREKFINEMEWPSINLFANLTNYDETAGHEYATIEVINPVFWEGIGRETEVEIKYYDEDGKLQTTEETWSVLKKHHRDIYGFKVNMSQNDGMIKDDDKAPVISPYLFFNYVVRELLRMNGFYLDKNFFDPENYPSMVVYNNFNIMFFNYILVSTEGWIYYEHPWLGTIAQPPSRKDIWKVHEFWWEHQPFQYRDLLPKISMKDLLIGIQNLFNVVFVFRKNRKVDIIDRQSILDEAAFDLDAYFIGDWEIGERLNVTLKFISEYDRDDAMFGQDYHDITERKANIKEPVADMAALEALPRASLEVGEIRLVESLNKYYEYKWDVYADMDRNLKDNQVNVLQWVFISNGPQPLLYGDGQDVEEIRTHISTLQLEKYLIGAKKPTVMQRGNLGHMRNVWNNFSFRLMFYAGGHFGGPKDAQGENSLNWEGENGIFEKRWKKWARFWSTRQPVDGEFELPLNVLSYLISNITGKFRTRHGEFIIEDLEVEVAVNSMGKARIKAYKL